MAKKGGAKGKPKPTKKKLAAQSSYRLPSIWVIAKRASLTLWDSRELFLGIILVYGLLDLVLVKGFSAGLNVASAKAQASGLFHGSLGSSINVFGQLLGNSGGSQAGGAWQFGLILVASLAIIWALRQVLSGAKIRVRDSYYRGMTPLIPFTIILFLIGIELIPLAFGAYVYGTVIAGGIAISVLEKVVFGVLFVGLAMISLYFISSSLFALYIVTLADMTPLKALRSAKELVRQRRLLVIRKLLGLQLLLLITAAIIMLPVIILIDAVAAWLFFVLGLLAILAAHAYMYTLYRELLQ